MNNPLHAKFYADAAGCYDVTVVHRRELAHETYLVRFACAEIAERILPGQFVMLRWPDSAEPILGRAFALYDLDEEAEARHVDIVFHIVGKITSRLAQIRAGDRLHVWGPLGNGFPALSVDHLVMVAGGIGQTPFMAVAKEYLGIRDFGRSASANKVTLCYGARSAKYLAGVEDFEKQGVDVLIATDDGSLGHHGLVTDLLRQVLKTKNVSRVFCCGPEKMMEGTSIICADQDLPCDVSLETPMACGIGICFSCVTRVRESDGQWDYKRTCVDGPVFDSSQLIW